MAIEYQSRSLLPVFGLAGGTFLAGVLLCGAVMSQLQDARSTALARQAGAVKTRISLLESILKRQAVSVASLSTAPAPRDGPRIPSDEAVPAQIAEGGGAHAATTAAPVVLTSSPARREVPARRETRESPAKREPVPVQSAATASVAPAASRGADALPKPVSPEAIASAKATNRIEGIGAEKIGISRIETGGVVMRNGGRIVVGGRFPSGERLLAVDPASQQIVTDSRTVLVFTD